LIGRLSNVFQSIPAAKKNKKNESKTAAFAVLFLNRHSSDEETFIFYYSVVGGHL